MEEKRATRTQKWSESHRNHLHNTFLTPIRCRYLVVSGFQMELYSGPTSMLLVVLNTPEVNFPPGFSLNIPKPFTFLKNFPPKWAFKFWMLIASMTGGYGNLGPTGCKGNGVNGTWQNSYRSYGGVISRKFHVDSQWVSQSGWGIIKGGGEG